MITVIDRITYLPKYKLGKLLTENDRKNRGVKIFFHELKSYIQLVETDGKTATAEVVGRVVEKGEFLINIKVSDCDDPSLEEKILAVTKRYG